MKRARIDTVLVERGLFPSRTAAARAVRAGEVWLGADGPIALQPSQQIEPDATLIVEEKPRFVSRGGIKLENALERLGIEVDGRDCLDIGASTGGFTDCLLQRGAPRVAAVDVGHGQIDFKLREDPRVTVFERFNARDLQPGVLPFEPDLATIDVSFIGLAKVMPAVNRCLGPDGDMLAMVKPQFELGPEWVRKGVVRDPEYRRQAITGAATFATELGFVVKGFAASGLAGPKGNKETFVWAGRHGEPVEDIEAAVLEVDP